MNEHLDSSQGDSTLSPYLEIHSSDDVRIKGTRVGIEHLLSAYLSGAQPEEIAIEFPTVTLEQIHGVLAYYLGHRDKIDAYLQRWRDGARQSRAAQAMEAPPTVVQRLRTLAEQRVPG
jgi:uncharacterized protein (DUF433 family)